MVVTCSVLPMPLAQDGPSFDPKMIPFDPIFLANTVATKKPEVDISDDHVDVPDPVPDPFGFDDDFDFLGMPEPETMRFSSHLSDQQTQGTSPLLQLTKGRIKRFLRKNQEKEEVQRFLKSHGHAARKAPWGLSFLMPERLEPIHLAAREGDGKVLCALLRGSKDIDLHQRTSKGRTALDVARQENVSGSHDLVITILSQVRFGPARSLSSPSVLCLLPGSECLPGSRNLEPRSISDVGASRVPLEAFENREVPFVAAARLSELAAEFTGDLPDASEVIDGLFVGSAEAGIEATVGANSRQIAYILNVGGCVTPAIFAALAEALSKDEDLTTGTSKTGHGEVQEGLFLDDPSRSKVNIADLKSFLTADEDGTVESPYNDARLIRNQVRAYASNDLKELDATEKEIGTTLPAGRFLLLLDELFAGEKEKDVLAVLKRAIILLFTESALYLRLPSEDKEAIVHRVCLEDIHKDLLAEKDKPQYGKYKAGIVETGPTFDAEVQREQAMVDDAMTMMSKYDKLHDYVQFINGQLQDHLFRHQDIRVIPSSQTSEEGPEVAWGAAPVPPIGTDPPGRFRRPFVYPGRRVRSKTSPASQDLEGLTQAAEEALAKEDVMAEQVEAVQLGYMELEADAEAAAAMGLSE
eukprot:Skav227922  [mRNA]  locus=scaffold146:177871:189157:+ [translate_table: standard]